MLVELLVLSHTSLFSMLCFCLSVYLEACVVYSQHSRYPYPCLHPSPSPFFSFGNSEFVFLSL